MSERASAYIEIVVMFYLGNYLDIRAYTFSPAFAMQYPLLRLVAPSSPLQGWSSSYPSDIIYSAILARRGLSAVWMREPLDLIDPARYCRRSRRRQVSPKRRFRLVRLDILTFEEPLMIHRNTPMSTSSRVESNVVDL